MKFELTETQKIDFIKKAAFIADKSTCNYKIGCVGVIKDVGQSISDTAKLDSQFRRKHGLIYLKTWNETIKGELYCQHCDEHGKKICIRESENLKGRDFQKVCSIHAEQNLIAKCARYGISTEGMKIFITNTPCYVCSKSIIQAAVSELYYLAEHTDKSGMNLLEQNEVQIQKLNFSEIY